jgi:hypothetical protein
LAELDGERIELAVRVFAQIAQLLVLHLHLLMQRIDLG